MIEAMQNAMPQLRPINDVNDDFAVLRKNHAIYVDKTAHVLQGLAPAP